ncbi:tRNA (guanine-N(7)-)-methyltransferase [Clostridium sp. CAG:762]|nr:tRNA (guanine-N(7)-)-methyltransferase [Clostridium sp. CAG:762]
MNFKVDKDTCIGCGACINTCEEVFDYDDDGLAKVISNNITDESIIDSATDAMNACPVGAISNE